MTTGAEGGTFALVVRARLGVSNRHIPEIAAEILCSAFVTGRSESMAVRVTSFFFLLAYIDDRHIDISDDIGLRNGYIDGIARKTRGIQDLLATAFHFHQTSCRRRLLITVFPDERDRDVIGYRFLHISAVETDIIAYIHTLDIIVEPETGVVLHDGKDGAVAHRIESLSGLTGIRDIAVLTRRPAKESKTAVGRYAR